MRYFIQRGYSNEPSINHYYAVNDNGDEGFYVLISNPNRACRTDEVDCQEVLERYTQINRCKLRKLWKHPIITEMPQ